MKRSRAVRVPVVADVLIEGLPDYADCFEIDIDETDPRSAEDFARDALERAPALIYWTIHVAHRYVLRFHLAPRSSPFHVVGWTVVVNEPDVAKLTADGPLVRAAVVGRRSGSSVRVTTAVFFKQRMVANALMTLLAPVHRSVAAYLLEHASARSSPRYRSGTGRS